ncbi:MAG: hypothetical protein JXR37_02495 [Kiritimatiellae bacterium]|nr:hypothetical protein [Kiritimatiellia bacterium]
MCDITQPLAAGNWGFSDVGTIQEVYISCFGATEYDWEHQTKGVRVR